MLTPYFNDNDHFILYQGDTNYILSEIKDKVDVIFADPHTFYQTKKNGTCELLGVNPRDWLNDVFSKIAGKQEYDAKALLPFN